MECFFAGLKKEPIHGMDYTTREEVGANLFESIESSTTESGGIR